MDSISKILREKITAHHKQTEKLPDSLAIHPEDFTELMDDAQAIGLIETQNKGDKTFYGVPLKIDRNADRLRGPQEADGDG